MSNGSTFVRPHCWTNNVRQFDPSLCILHPSISEVSGSENNLLLLWMYPKYEPHLKLNRIETIEFGRNGLCCVRIRVTDEPQRPEFVYFSCYFNTVFIF